MCIDRFVSILSLTSVQCASSVSGPMLPVICNFLIKSLSDEVDVVREGIMDAGKSIIDAGGEQCVSQMLPTFENYFERFVVRTLSRQKSGKNMCEFVSFFLPTGRAITERAKNRSVCVLVSWSLWVLLVGTWTNPTSGCGA